MAAALASRAKAGAAARQDFTDRIATIPLGRWRESADIANMAASWPLLSPDYLTGLSISIAGGAMMELTPVITTEQFGPSG